jgi:endo-1,4-beta-xylanase
MRNRDDKPSIEVMVSRRSLLASVPLGALAGASIARAMSLRPSILEDDTAGLRRRAQTRGIGYGTAASSYQLRDHAFATVLAREAEILVPEYELKRGVIEQTRGRFDFLGCDALVQFAGARGMAVRGHPLVWHKRNPGWLDEALLNWRDPDLLAGYVSKVVGHFRGSIHSWDVVNEAIAPADGRRDGLRESLWLKAFGPGYIDTAYHAARAADPTAMLVYNDWGCEAGAPDNDRFRAATLTFLEQSLARGVPIDALGLQGHLSAFGTQVDQDKLARFLGDVKSLGLRILVTELDVDDSGGPLEADARDRAVADATRRFLDVMLANRATVAVLTWGLSDRFLDPPGWRQRLEGYTPRMLPLDSELNRTPMWHAMARSFASG